MTETETKTATPKSPATASAAAPAPAPPYTAAAGDTVTDVNGRCGLVVAADKDRGGAEIPDGEAAEPLVVWLPEPAPYGGELTPLS